jgi:2-polyprenyl-3-methyl-5-hydroxy-6-metoxy-1,4-benzoquinol methylase
MLEIYKKYDCKLNIFATHRTDVFANFSNLQIGIHPNFLSGSTHGESIEEVVDHMFEIFPDAETYRSHAYFDNQKISELMAERGIKYDANICTYLQENLTPLQHCHGSLRFPSFFDDNVHWFHNGSWDFEEYRKEFFTPGLKIINFHPYPIALNIPDIDYYNRNRDVFSGITPELIEERRYNAKGPRNFMIQLLEAIGTEHPTYHFRDLYNYYSGKNKSPTEVQGRPSMSGNYNKASLQERKKMVREQYDQMDSSNKYITSRDYNLRELEIEAIRSHLKEGQILDCGCGNGYTLLSLAKTLENSMMVGVDFSENLIEGAKRFKEDMKSEILSEPNFICSDVDDFLSTSTGKYDCIITERFIVNLPSIESQYEMISKLLDRLEPDGKLILVEGSSEGFNNLNTIRAGSGLAMIPDVYAGNDSSIKLDSETIRSKIAEWKGVELLGEQDFEFYSIASKVLHPLFVKPHQPQFSSRLNDTAKIVQSSMHEIQKQCSNVGACHIWVFQKSDES